MTAIVCRDGVMAADSVAWAADGHVKVVCSPKIFRVPDGGLCGCAGNSDDIETFRNWMLGSGIPQGASFQREDSFCCIMLKSDGTIWRCWSTLKWTFSPVEFAVEGACENFIYGALFAGASAEQAVRLAVQHTDGAGGDVQVEYLKPGYPSTFHRIAATVQDELLHKASERTPTMAKWEDSPADRAADRKGAKKASVPMGKWEGSKADRKTDAAAMKKKKKKK